MVSDKFIMNDNSWSSALDKVEGFAACYDFDTKSVLQIRLITEEIINIIRPAMQLADAYCWVSTTQEAFSVSVSCGAGGEVMDEKTKKVLLEIGKNTFKEGIFGAIGKVFKYLSDTPGSSHMVPNYGLVYHNMGVGMGTMSTYHWTPEFEEELAPATAAKADEAADGEANDHSLEISIVEGFADDIQVYLRKGANKERRLEVTLVKNFVPKQLKDIVVVQEKS